jgi:hypothetical protein
MERGIPPLYLHQGDAEAEPVKQSARWCRSLSGRPRRSCRLEGRFSGCLGLVMKASTIKGGVEVVVVAV